MRIKKTNKKTDPTNICRKNRKGWWEVKVSSESMTSLPPTDRHIYNLKKQKQSFERLLLLLVFISLYTVWIQSAASCFWPAALTLRQLTGQPVQTLVQTSTLSGTGGLDMPLMRQKDNTVRNLERWVLVIKSELIQTNMSQIEHRTLCWNYQRMFL